MANPRDIRRHIKSVQNTAQITRAMQMVAASKMRRAQEAAVAGRPYALELLQGLAMVMPSAEDFVHPLVLQRPIRTRALIVVSTDKGLCGALNSNLMREAATYDKDTTVFIAAGKKAAQFLARTKRKLIAEFTYRDTPLFREARAISRYARELFLKGEVDQVDVMFTNFVSTLAQRTLKLQMLPVCDILSITPGLRNAMHKQPDAAKPANGGAEMSRCIYEPSARKVFDALLPHHLNYLMYQVLLEAKASEHSARMVAMKNATDNARDLLKDLTLEYNQLRQANITRELLEISSATMAAS